MVEYYGSMVPVNQVANITPDRCPHDRRPDLGKADAGKVERAIRDSDLGLNPANMGELLRVPMPALTEERRRDLTKVVRHEGETAKVAIRNLRRDANQQLKGCGQGQGDLRGRRASRRGRSRSSPTACRRDRHGCSPRKSRN